MVVVALYSRLPALQGRPSRLVSHWQPRKGRWALPARTRERQRRVLDSPALPDHGTQAALMKAPGSSSWAVVFPLEEDGEEEEEDDGEEEEEAAPPWIWGRRSSRSYARASGLR